MNVFVAGGTGTIGVPLVRALVAAGHKVHSLTRSEKKILEIRSLGAEPAVADALDADALRRVVVAARPTCIANRRRRITTRPISARNSSSAPRRSNATNVLYPAADAYGAIHIDAASAPSTMTINHETRLRKRVACA